jgi:ATP-dependent DNA helicase RecQ
MNEHFESAAPGGASMDTARRLLGERFGHGDFLPGQERVIEYLMSGRSAAAVFPTGAGKSLCYQLPALLLPGLTLVVSPLIALMKDQIDQLQARGIEAERLDSTLTLEQYREIMGKTRSGTLKLLYAAPERFNNERFRDVIGNIRVSLFAVDEAHCISEWGHNFRPDYLKLAAFGKLCGAERVLALTATATPKVLDDVCRGFAIESDCAVRTGFYRPNLELLFTPVAAADRDKVLLDRFRSRPTGPTIVYVTLQRTAERVAAFLAEHGLPARPYHAGMKNEDRTATQDWFLGSSDGVVVATIAFGMGVDKPDIRFVYHYNLAKSLENLSQEIGRAGRDGRPAICETLICPDDLETVRNFAYGDTPGRGAVQRFVDLLLAGGDQLDLALYDLGAQTDIRLLVLRTLLTYLELDGLTEAATPYYSSYRFRPLVGLDEIIGRFKGERRRFVEGLFDQSSKKAIWYDIDLGPAARALGSPRTRLMRALDYFAEQGLLEVRAAGLRHRYRWLRRPDDVEALVDRLHQRTLEHEVREIARLVQVLELAGHDGCQTAKLCYYFGETLEHDCGHCSWCCGGGRPVELIKPMATSIDEETWQRATEVRRQHGDVLAEPRAFARFLVGLSSPRLTRARVSREELYGSMAHVGFAKILERIKCS